MPATVFLLLVALCVQAATANEKADSRRPGHVSVVIVGGTGDLAKKYLWQGFFELYVDQVSSGNSFSFYGGGQSAADTATPLLFDILKGVTCSEHVSPERCAVLKEQFLKLSKYRQLRTSEQYRDLAEHIEQQLQREGMAEAGRLFYLSIPAFAYADVAQKIDSSCRPSGGAWLKVVLEKPFGHDLRSAQVLASQLATSLRDEEMYRIDHYLGKQVVAKILPFRVDNKKHLDPIWNRHHIERIEIVLKETLDVKGRISFYDQYGVIRDVIQNHLTEVMTLLTSRIPKNLSDTEEVQRNKLHVFRSLLPLGKSQAVVGQYQSYQSEVQQELNKTKDHMTLTPTFAAVLVHLDDPQYEGIPILLTSGKMLDERVGYARVLFKSHVLCLQKHDGVHCKPRQIVFHFGHGSLQHPAILVSRNLFRPASADSRWTEVTEHARAHSHAHADTHVLGLPISDYHVLAPAEQRGAYTQLIADVLAGRKSSFVGGETLLASWRAWTPLLDGLADAFPRVYPGGAANGDLLDVSVGGAELGYHREVVIIGEEQRGADAFRAIGGKFRGDDMVSAWPEQLVARLAADVQEAAEAAVGEGGVFHLALSGGATPLALFHRLARHHFSFPWSRTHVWLVDERCVPPAEAQSNFHSVHEHLLRHVRVPYDNVHPMPVQVGRRLCAAEDGGAAQYESRLAERVDGSRLDFVLLGVGQDGHTASLFPGVRPDEHGGRLVALAEGPAEPRRRMTLTFEAINRAHKVALLVMGKGKHELVTQLSRVKSVPEKYPVTAVRPTDGTLVWYIDYDALLS